MRRHHASHKKFRCLLSITFIFLLVVLRPAVAMDLCDDRFSRPDFDFHSPSPDLSHTIFNEPRWRCVTQTIHETEVDSSIKPFTGFADAVAQCSAAAEGASAPEGSSYEQLLGMADANAAAVKALGTLHTDVTEESACVLWSSNNPAIKTDSYIGQFQFSIHGPATWRLYSGTLEGEAIRFATLIPWDKSGSELKSFTVEYTPEHQTSRCNDPLCTGGPTKAAQYRFGPIEPGHGTVDIEVPLLKAEYPGLIPLSLHYSSWDIVKKTRGRSLDAIEPNREPVEETGAGTYWYRSWHHSYDKRLAEDYRGNGVLAPFVSSGDPEQLYIYLPSEDVLVFEKDGETWASVSHPGVLTRIRSLGSENGYEAFHPNGYKERYDARGMLTSVRYPNGRTLDFTRTFDQETYQPALKIEQTNPAAGALIVEGYTGEIRRVSDLNNPNYRFNFKYRESVNFAKPQLTAITRPDGTVLNVGQQQVSQQPEQFDIDHGYFLLESIELDGHALLTIEYHEDGRAKSVTRLNGERVEVEYNESGVLIASPYGAHYRLSITDQPVGDSRYFGATTIPSIVSGGCPNCGYIENYHYDHQGLITNVERTGTLPFSADYSQGLLNRFAYGTQSIDIQWNPDQQKIKGIDGTEVLRTRLNHDGQGQLVQVSSTRDDQARSIQVERDTAGRVTRIGSPNNVVTPDDQKTIFSYGALGRLTDATAPSGRATHFKYTPLGQLAGQRNTNWGERSYHYSKAHLLTSRQTPQYIDSYYYYDGDRPLSIIQRRKDATRPSITVNYQYDDTSSSQGTKNFGIGRLTEVENGASHYQYRYDAQGQLIEQKTFIATTSHTERTQTRYR